MLYNVSWPSQRLPGALPPPAPSVLVRYHIPQHVIVDMAWQGPVSATLDTAPRAAQRPQPLRKALCIGCAGEAARGLRDAIHMEHLRPAQRGRSWLGRGSRDGPVSRLRCGQCARLAQRSAACPTHELCRDTPTSASPAREPSAATSSSLLRCGGSHSSRPRRRAAAAGAGSLAPGPCHCWECCAAAADAPTPASARRQLGSSPSCDKVPQLRAFAGRDGGRCRNGPPA